jgi:Fic family protein
VKRSEFAKTASGELRQSVQGHLRFVPNPLPPKMTFTESLVGLISRSERALGELHALSGMVPNAMLFIQPFMSREAVLSSRIEGTQTQLEELLQADAEMPAGPASGKPGVQRTGRVARESVEQTDLREVQNYVRALQTGLARLREIPLCLRLIREVHAVLMEGVRGQEKSPGEFRRQPVMIGRKGQRYEEARFVPPEHTELDRLLGTLERFLNESGELSTVVVAALTHYQFEAIHPFTDGNGRVGRLLIALLLQARGALAQPLLYLSAYFEKHDAEYRDQLLAVSQRGTWAEWVAFFARGVEEQSQDAIRRSRRMLALQADYRTRLQETSQSSTVLRLIDELFRTPYATVRGAARRLEVTPRAARMNIEKLIFAGVLEQLPATERRRFYHAPAILDLLLAPSIDTP